ncbi:neutral/alkaline non-lysosomal ceramidase N-terminal domain-containing protein [Pontibacter sp. MBLB2868]|uniref:neutral/alkaline non-lysosomal ceramidase N-terminal domain-containing protein n=1 Tax=Pontibacter sp. MBLB2868 TaxID=3451555 RepID=UPI003F75483D
MLKKACCTAKKKNSKLPAFLLICFLLLGQSCIIQKLDRTPYQESDYYQETNEQINRLPTASAQGDTLQVGWAKVNITPPVGTPLAGYGKRRGMKYTSVHDSVWVRTFAFNNGINQVYYVSLDMLIAPMSVSAELERQYVQLGIKPEQVYLSATHTHTSFGGWGKKVAGRIMAGKYKKEVVKQTAQYILQSIALAKANQQQTRVGYGTANGAAFVKNRLTGSETARDTTIRFLKFERENGEQAILCTFSAHPTILPSMQPVLSGDYPNVLVQELEKAYAFAVFSAGAVGSHSSIYDGENFESVQHVGRSLAGIILAKAPQVHTNYTLELTASRLPLYLPEPQWRIGNNRRFAPGLFYAFFGKYNTYINTLQVGSTLLVGVPADFSGELMPALEEQAHQYQSDLILTGFNGSYLGYVIPDKHYQLKKYEARAMNFYGPFSGSYLTHTLRQILKQQLQ